jgi:hypothetical protein
MTPHPFHTALLALLVAAPLLAADAHAQAAPTGAHLHPGSGKLLLTGGMSSLDGAAGGGLTPWAVIGSYATDGEYGATAFATRVRTQDYALTSYGAAVGIADRVELSLARQAFDARAAVPGATLRLDIVGVKVKLAGDAVLDADTWMPQLAVGAEFKHVSPGAAVGAVLDAVAARRDGVDLYLSATKLWLAPGILLSGTLRATRANQNGLLGFGSAAQSGYKLMPEVSLAWLLRRDLALGTELRAKPDHLAFAGAPYQEDAWKDLFVAWAPNKTVSLTAAYVDLGNIVGHPHQTGGYLSLQLAY